MITWAIPQLPEADPSLLEGEIYEDPSSVAQLQRLEDLRTALTHFSSMDASGVATEPDLRYGSPRQFNPADTAEARGAAVQAEHDLAFAWFARAYLGAAAFRGAEVHEPNSSIYKLAWTAFQGFKNRYASPRNDKAREDYREELSNQIAVLEGKEPPYKLALPSRRKPDTESYPKKLGEGDERELTLTTREKVRVLAHEDERAGFLPTTHREKNAAVELLDYMSVEIRNPLTGRVLTTPDSIDERLTQIYLRQIGVVRKRYEKEQAAAEEAEEDWDGPEDQAITEEAQTVAKDTVRSVINEWDDYRSNALYSLHALVHLDELASEYGQPSTKLAELLSQSEANGLDVQPLLRYIDLRFFCDTGELPAFDPLRTREIRPAPPEFTTKNKIVVDPYLHVPDRQEQAEEFQAMIEAVDMRTVRELIKDAIKDSQRRHAFFNHALQNITGVHRDYARSVSRTSKMTAA